MSNPMMTRANARGGAGSRQRQSSPLNEIMQARRSGMSPMQFVQQRLKRTPQAQEAMKMLGGTQDQLQATAQTLAQQMGIDLNAFVQEASSMLG